MKLLTILSILAFATISGVASATPDYGYNDTNNEWDTFSLPDSHLTLDDQQSLSAQPGVGDVGDDDAFDAAFEFHNNTYD